MQRSLLGGSEPLFMLLLLGTFLSVRREEWWIASLLAALATTVRPLGICALIAIGLVLLSKKHYRRFLAALTTGLLICGLYVLPLHLYMHDALATVHSYQSSRPLFGIPFYAIVEGTFSHPPLTNLILSYSWIAMIIGGILLLAFSAESESYRQTHRVEFIFALFYTTAICCYNYPHWALGNFARFAIPSIPFALIGWRHFLASRLQTVPLVIPAIRNLVWAAAAVFPALAACSAYGIRNILR
jgi:hypothetical protein